MYKLLTFLVSFISLQYYAYADDRVLVVDYSPNQIVEVYIGSGYTTTIEFGSENVNAVAIGDTTNFQASPFKNKVFIKSTENVDAKGLKATNMTVVTDKRDYYFQVYLNSKNGPTFVLKFRYRGKSSSTARNHSTLSPLSPVRSHQNYNSSSNNSVRANNQVAEKPVFSAGNNALNIERNDQLRKNLLLVKKIGDHSNYRISLNSKILVDSVYDNGVNTFFVFNNKQKIPDIYYINEEGREFLLVPEIDKSGIVSVNKISERFTLRFGDEIACILNDKLLNPELYKQEQLGGKESTPDGTGRNKKKAGKTSGKR